VISIILCSLLGSPFGSVVAVEHVDVTKVTIGGFTERSLLLEIDRTQFWAGPSRAVRDRVVGSVFFPNRCPLPRIAAAWRVRCLDNVVIIVRFDDEFVVARSLKTKGKEPR
jgi:hypothetical protein